ncbi:hypothetical protein ACFLUG_04720 [Chloroflexota bacterium]
MEEMDESKLIEEIVSKRNELERSKSSGVSNSLLRVLEEEIAELEDIFATGDVERMKTRAFADQCAEKEESSAYLPQSS